ncbi:flagellar FliJ family protein [Pilimelia columellifera]|uniref:Flagellar FliJ protein n=1 Tax=Pilimelia columellifera subsp. columellifera TaxID=706583 RepID=A0ABN3N7Y9_9ACTN
MARFRLSTVLRARQAQEDVRKAEVVRARGAARHARRNADERADALRATDASPVGTARAVVAALAARHALAAGLSAAHHAIGEADAHVDAQTADLAEAAKRRRVVERLGERHAAAQKAHAAAVEQRAIDEIAITAAARAGDLIS